MLHDVSSVHIFFASEENYIHVLHMLQNVKYLMARFYLEFEKLCSTHTS